MKWTVGARMDRLSRLDLAVSEVGDLKLFTGLLARYQPEKGAGARGRRDRIA